MAQGMSMDRADRDDPAELEAFAGCMLGSLEPQAREARYARRELLGLTTQDREKLLDAVVEHLTETD